MSAQHVEQPAHRRTPTVEDPNRPGRYLVACSCGDYEDNLPSKRAAARWLGRHMSINAADLADELATPQGRGRLASMARRRALEELARRHPAELATLESAERQLVGLNPLPAYLSHGSR